ncbi:MAG: AMP-binding protein, partial [Acidimicrobiia bacterium]|nr:AMP-binding protein [Acidimicrobiia bacterium]
AIAMPMTLEAVVAYLATVAIGGAVVSIADSFAPEEIARRLRISDAEVVVTQDEMVRSGRSLPMYAKVRDATDLPTVVVETGAVLDDQFDVTWTDLLSTDGQLDPVTVGSDHVSNILFSSGTTGDPKAIPWTHLTPIKGAMDAHFLHDVHRGDVVAWPTNLGWMMGPWLIYASLVNGAAMALFDDAPIGPEFCRFVADAEVTMLGVVPSMVRSWRSTDATAGVDWSHIKVFSSTGEASTPSDMDWLMHVPGQSDGTTRPVIEYCGGTEIGGGYIAGSVLQPAISSTFSMPALGLDIRILDDEGEQSTSGTAYLVPPAVGLSDRLLNRDHDEVYYQDLPITDVPLRRHGDQMERLENGYHRARGRSDDTMNLGGIKVSSAELEEAVGGLDGVLETAAVAVPPDDGGPDRLVIFAVPQPEQSLDSESIRLAMQDRIKARLNPLFKVSEVSVVDALPRTASNKVMRRVLRNTLTDGDL